MKEVWSEILRGTPKCIFALASLVFFLITLLAIYMIRAEK